MISLLEIHPATPVLRCFFTFSWHYLRSRTSLQHRRGHLQTSCCRPSLHRHEAMSCFRLPGSAHTWKNHFRPRHRPLPSCLPLRNYWLLKQDLEDHYWSKLRWSTCSTACTIQLLLFISWATSNFLDSWHLRQHFHHQWNWQHLHYVHSNWPSSRVVSSSLCFHESFVLYPGWWKLLTLVFGSLA